MNAAKIISEATSLPTGEAEVDSAERKQRILEESSAKKLEEAHKQLRRVQWLQSEATRDFLGEIQKQRDTLLSVSLNIANSPSPQNVNLHVLLTECNVLSKCLDLANTGKYASIINQGTN